MSETLSFSIFTIEADRKPLLAFGAKKYQEAEAFCADEPNSHRSDQAAFRSAMTIRSCVFGWQHRTKEHVTTNKRRRDRPWKTLQRSFWSKLTKPNCEQSIPFRSSFAGVQPLIAWHPSNMILGNQWKYHDGR
jgi:hypothetical protein